MKINPIYATCFKGSIEPQPRFFKNSEYITILNIPHADADCHLTTDRFEHSKDYQDKIEKGQILCDDGSTIFNRGTTHMFRGDLNWNIFANYLKEKYSKDEKVNSYVYGCSKGSEAYSLSILLQQMFDEESAKFFPIKAKDINKDVLYRQGAVCFINKDDIRDMRYLTFLNSENKSADLRAKYITKNSIALSLFPYKLKNNVINTIEFEKANILDDIENIDSDNPSILMARNMWPYIDPDEYEDFAQKLYDKLAPNSIVVLGYYDFEGEKIERFYKLQDSDKFPEALVNAGFNISDCKIGLYKKKKNLIFEKN